MTPLKLFYSYSHADEEYKNELKTHLEVLKNTGYITDWNDRDINAGDDWKKGLNQNLEEADIILLLVSSDFLASKYCYAIETMRALEKNDTGESIVIPILLRPCLWLESVLSEVQSLPRDNKAISTFQNMDEAWVEVAEGILEKIKKSDLAKKNFEEINQQNHSKNNLHSDPDSCRVIFDFLVKYQKYYFSPLRIQKWGGEQNGFKKLKEYTTSEIRNCLKAYPDNTNKKLSKKGNLIYQAR